MKTLLPSLILGLFVLIPPSPAADAAAGAAETAAIAGYVPAKIHQKTRPVYPMRLISEGIVRGEATVLLEISAEGKLADRLLISCTHAGFGDEALRTVSEWTFEAGRQDGRPVSSVVAITFQFGIEGTIAYDKQFEGLRDEAFYRGRFSYFPRGAASLDRKPLALNVPQPIYPKEWIEQGRSGTVRIQFYIDETGRARLPVIVSEGDSLLAAAAVAAVKDWRFEVPTFRGKPVLAQAEQEFVFQPPAVAKPKS